MSAGRGETWQCSQCGQTVETQFEACWKCGTSREGTKDTSFTPEQSPAGGGDSEPGAGESSGRASWVASPEECAGLREIARRRVWVWVWLATFIPVACGAVSLLGDRVDLLLTVWMGVWGALVLRTSYARCPRCRRCFNGRSMYGNPFTQHCLNCGLELDAAVTPDEWRPDRKPASPPE
jgi:hypothetical protein